MVSEEFLNELLRENARSLGFEYEEPKKAEICGENKAIIEAVKKNKENSKAIRKIKKEEDT